MPTNWEKRYRALAKEPWLVADRQQAHSLVFDQNGTNTCGSLTCARNWNSDPWLRARLESGGELLATPSLIKIIFYRAPGVASNAPPAV